MTRFLFAVLTLLLIAGAACATCAVRARVTAAYAAAAYVAPVYAAPVVAVEKVVEKVIAPVAVYAPVPVYSAVYSPPCPPMPPAGNGHGNGGTAELKRDDLRQILEALQALDARLKAIERPTNLPAPVPPHPIPPPVKPPPVKPPPTKPPPTDPFVPPKKTGSLEAPPPATALAVLNNRCASCHEEKVSGDHGGGFTLLQGGKVLPLTDRQAMKVATMSYSGRMPPKKSGITMTDQEVAIVIDWIDTLPLK